MISTRMGSAHYAQRLAIERGRLIEYHQPVSPKMTALKIKVFRPILAFGLHALGLYRRGYIQFHNLRIRHNTFHISGLPPAFAGYTLLQMSDLHIDLDPTLVETIAAAIRGLKYDICVMTGDFRNSTIGPWDEVLPPMRRLRAAIAAPTYAVLGNHDFIDMIDPLEAAGIGFLVNESLALTRDGATIHLVGIDDPNIYGTHDLEHALKNVPAGAVKVLLSHSPAIHREAEAHGIQVVLAGHTHGGQVCLPGGRILVRNDKSPRRFLRGSWRYRELQGYTSSGTGSCGVPIRFNCPPEVTLHTLMPATDEDVKRDA
jgi:predicted MPP superfamily phosphohydrolase